MHPEVAIVQELVDIVPGQPLRRTDRSRFLRALGCKLESPSQKDEILKSVGDAAYELPLPPRWSEQVDIRGYVYFSNALRTDATWQHPLLPAFRETFDFAARTIDESLTAENLQEAASSVQAHLEHVQARASRHLQEWTGPHKTDSCEDEFFFNEITEESSWENPLEVWQYDLHARYWLLVQVLQQLHDRQLARRPIMSVVTLPGEIGAAPDTPRFNDRSASSVPALPLTGLLGEDTASAMEDTLSTSGLSAAVRSHATTIASSLISSALSFKPQSECSMGSAHLRIPPGQRPGSAHPRPPRRPPPPLRHLAAPPRVSDVPPESALRAPSPPGSSGTGAASPHSADFRALVVPPPPPPSQPSAGQVVRRVAQTSQPAVAPAPPPPAPAKYPAAEMHDLRHLGEKSPDQCAPPLCHLIAGAQSMTKQEQMHARAARPRPPSSIDHVGGADIGRSGGGGGSGGGGVFPGLLRPALAQEAIVDEVPTIAEAHIPDFGVVRPKADGIAVSRDQLPGRAAEGIFASVLETVTLEPLGSPVAPPRSRGSESGGFFKNAEHFSGDSSDEEEDSNEDIDCPTPRAISPDPGLPQQRSHTWAVPAGPSMMSNSGIELARTPQLGSATGQRRATAKAPAQKLQGPLSHKQANAWCGHPTPAPRKSAWRIADALPCTVM
mmetsp:Transcript_6815/g.18803  ORF Transcript_6815/g.18803 Transcript_6815/m.18803 type:complete len:668 (+) Transcript_6815:172-2175(+)